MNDIWLNLLILKFNYYIYKFIFPGPPTFFINSNPNYRVNTSGINEHFDSNPPTISREHFRNLARYKPNLYKVTLGTQKRGRLIESGPRDSTPRRFSHKVGRDRFRGQGNAWHKPIVDELLSARSRLWLGRRFMIFIWRDRARGVWPFGYGLPRIRRKSAGIDRLNPVK